MSLKFGNVTGIPQILDVPKNLWQDARLVVLDDGLYLVFNGAVDGGVRRTFIAQAYFDGVEFSLKAPQALLHFPGENPTQWERNWVPFVYNNALFLSTHLSPHRILRPLPGSQECEEIASSNFSSSWMWGTPKTGTTAHLDGKHYLAFFHSIKVMPSIHSEGKPIQHYFMGAYTPSDSSAYISAAPKPLESTIVNGVVLANTTPFTIVDSREFSRQPKCRRLSRTEYISNKNYLIIGSAKI